MFKFGRKLRYLIIPCIAIIVFLMYLTQWNAISKSLIEYDQGVWYWYNYTEDGLNGPKIAMDDPRLIKKLNTFVINNMYYHTSNHPYHLADPETMDPSMGQGEKIRNIINNRKNGFFIEVGALDGETRSNTLYFERYLNWTGLLIEPDPLNFIELVGKNRRALLSPTCLSTNTYPEIVLFEQNKNLGKIATPGSKISGSTVKVQCFPFYTYLLALNITHVDYFSLDVEGVELDVLKTIPFKEISIETLSVEFAHVPGGKDAVAEYMISQGYVVHSEVTHPNWLANDLIFMKI